MKKIVSILLLTMLISAIFSINNVYAGSKDKKGSKEEKIDITNPEAVIDSMEGAKNSMASANNSIGNIINTAIGLLQITGTGISVIVVSILGIKYLLASPSEKADTKKSILPIVIGCVLLFGAVNLIAAINDFAIKVLSKE